MRLESGPAATWQRRLLGAAALVWSTAREAVTGNAAMTALQAADTAVTLLPAEHAAMTALLAAAAVRTAADAVRVAAAPARGFVLDRAEQAAQHTWHLGQDLLTGAPPRTWEDGVMLAARMHNQCLPFSSRRRLPASLRLLPRCIRKGVICLMAWAEVCRRRVQRGSICHRSSCWRLRGIGSCIGA